MKWFSKISKLMKKKRRGESKTSALDMLFDNSVVKEHFDMRFRDADSSSLYSEFENEKYKSMEVRRTSDYSDIILSQEEDICLEREVRYMYHLIMKEIDKKRRNILIKIFATNAVKYTRPDKYTADATESIEELYSRYTRFIYNMIKQEQKMKY